MDGQSGQTRPRRTHGHAREGSRALDADLVAMYRDYDDYQARTDRDIPVVILSPRAEGGTP